MALPLTVAIVVLALIVGLLVWLVVRLLAQMQAITANTIQVTTDMAAAATRSQELAARNAPKQADAMISSLSGAISEVVDAVKGSMLSVYGPVHQSAGEDPVSGTPPLTPFYAAEGYGDYSDPTDHFMNDGMTDPAAGEALGNLIMDGDDSPFGIAGLKIDPAV
jgi:hypothetical protein